MTSHWPIQVRHPVATWSTGARLVLRTSSDWDVDVEPTASSAEGADFEIPAAGAYPFLDYKPCLRSAQGFEWSIGDNYCTWDRVRPQVIYPRFHGGGGRLTERFAVSDGSGRRHEVRIYLPPGYDENTLKRYPTLYAHDGANVFRPEEAFGSVPWDIDDTLDLLDTMSIVDKVIVVAVYARDGQRTTDYTAPGFDAYANFVADVLVPLVDAKVRTLPDRSQRATLGSSLGGVVAFHLAWSRADRFGKAACLSSTFGYADQLFERVASEPKRDLRLYLDSGWPRDNFEVTRRMMQLLVTRGYEVGRELAYLAFPMELHSERYWAARVHLPFQFLFGRAWAGAAVPVAIS